MLQLLVMKFGVGLSIYNRMFHTSFRAIGTFLDQQHMMPVNWRPPLINKVLRSTSCWISVTPGTIGEKSNYTGYSALPSTQKYQHGLLPCAISDFFRITRSNATFSLRSLNVSIRYFYTLSINLPVCNTQTQTTDNQHLHYHRLPFGATPWCDISVMNALEKFFGGSNLPSSVYLLASDNAKTHQGRLSDISKSTEDTGESSTALRLSSGSIDSQIPSFPPPPSVHPVVMDRSSSVPRKASSFTIGSYKKHMQPMPKSLFQLASSRKAETRWSDTSEELLPISPIRRASFDASEIQEAVAMAQRFVEESCRKDEED